MPHASSFCSLCSRCVAACNFRPAVHQEQRVHSCQRRVHRSGIVQIAHGHIRALAKTLARLPRIPREYPRPLPALQ